MIAPLVKSDLLTPLTPMRKAFNYTTPQLGIEIQPLENQYLELTRDLLLPRLLSGQVNLATKSATHHA